MGPLPTLSINHQALTVLEDRLQIQMRKDETASNREHLLTASGATPIGSTAVLPMIKLKRLESTHHRRNAVEGTGFVFNCQIETAKIGRTKFSRLDLRSNSASRFRRRRTRNCIGTRGSRSHHWTRLTSSNRWILKMPGSRPRVSRL